LGFPDQRILNRMITILDNTIEVLEMLLVLNLFIPLLLCVILLSLSFVGTSSVNNVCALALGLMQLVGTDTGRACRRP
jgi:uncharacterized membrane protein